MATRNPGRANFILETPAGKTSGYPIRITSIFASLSFHGIFLSYVFLAPAGQRSSTPIYDEFIKPHEHQILYYDYRKKKLPDVTPEKRTEPSKKPRAKQFSPRTVVAAPPKPDSSKQMIFTPAPKIELKQDIAAPDLIVKTITPVILQPPPKPSKAFKAPAQPAKQQAPQRPAVITTEAPRIDLANSQSANPLNVPAAPPKLAKMFVPPPAAAAKPGAAPVISAPAPSMSSPAASSQVALPETADTLLAPPPPAPVATPGNGKVDIAVANLNPPESAKPVLPEGKRAGEFSKAPEKGPPATGAETTAALTVPDLTIRGTGTNTPVKAPEEPPPTTTVLYSERVRNIPTTGLSVPLRPANRMIPAAIDSRFQGRNVYTIVIPIENMPAYSGDWIMWFASKDSAAGGNPIVRAPVPFRKIEKAGNEQRGRSGQRVQVSATLGANGKLTGISVITGAIPGLAEAAIQDIASWEFKPATRNGMPVEVDVVIEIPFNPPPALAKTGAP
jgi:TonB family protein